MKSTKSRPRTTNARPANTGKMQRPARAVSIQRHVDNLNRNWRDHYNPMRGLDAAKAVELFMKAQRGEFLDVQWAFAAPWTGIEVSDPTYMALIERCISPVEEMDWDVLITTGANGEPLAGTDAQLADDQAGVVRAAMDRITNFSEALAHLALARFRHYSHLQIVNSNGAPVLDGAEEFRVLNQWNFLRDGSDGDWYWNPDARSTNARAVGESNRLDPRADLLIVRTVGRFVGRVALVKTLRSALSEKDWDGFIEIFGIPARVIIGPPNMSPKQAEEFLEASENIKEGSGGALPNGSTVHSDEGVRGLQPFEARLEYLDKRLVLAGTGGMLTMLTESGSGTLAGGAHSETFKTIARAEARRISEIMQRQFVDRLLDLKFPGRPKLAYFEIAAEEEQDIGEVIEHNAKLAASGYRIAQAQLEERTHYNLEPHQPALPGAMTLNSRTEQERNELDAANASLVTDAVSKTLGARTELLKPFFEQLDAKAAAGELTDAQFLDALDALADQLPELLTPESVEQQAEIILGLLGAGVANQLAAALPAKEGA